MADGSTEEDSHEEMKTTQCYLLDLPAELRNHIYELALGPDNVKFGSLYRRSRTYFPDLMHVNRQIRAEVSDMWFMKSIFTFKYVPEAQRFLDLVGMGNARKIRSMCEEVVSWRNAEDLSRISFLESVLNVYGLRGSAIWLRWCDQYGDFLGEH